MKVLAAVALVALLVTACSKGGAPTKAQYTGVADGVCTAAHDELEKTAAEHRKTEPDGGANQRFVRSKVIPRLRVMVAGLRGIQAPENDGAYLDDIYSSYEHALDLWYADPLGDTSVRAGTAAEARMKSYGMKACAVAADIQVVDEAAG